MNEEDAIPPTKRWPNRPRLAAFNYTGAHAYHLVFNTARHQPLLVGAMAELVVQSIQGAPTATSFELLAYTVMPNHVHLLARGTTDSANVVRLVQRCKQKPGFSYKRETGNQLWLPSFFDRIVRRGDDAVEIAAYILANPVRAGLMPAEDLWPFSGGTLLEAESGPS